MHHAPKAAVLALVALLTACTAAPPPPAPSPSPSPSPSASVSSSPTAEARTLCDAASRQASKLLGDKARKPEYVSLGDDTHACRWQTRDTGWLAAVMGPAPLDDFAATLDAAFVEPMPWHPPDTDMWATSQGSGWSALWTSRAGVQVGVVVSGLDPEYNGMDLWSLAGELAGRD